MARGALACSRGEKNGWVSPVGDRDALTRAGEPPGVSYHSSELVTSAIGPMSLPSGRIHLHRHRAAGDAHTGGQSGGHCGLRV